MSDHLDEHLHCCLQHHRAAVRNVLENELGKDPGHVVTPGGKVGDDVLERVEGGPWVAEGAEREARGRGEGGEREGRGRGEEGEREGRGRGEGGEREGRGRGEEGERKGRGKGEGREREGRGRGEGERKTLHWMCRYVRVLEY